MKSGRLFTRTCCLLGFLLSTACGSRTEKASPDYPEFKMIVRLWPDHHKDSALREELLQALKKYPDFCDEVWLCMEFETFSKEAHKESARAMAVAAERLRNAGIGVSIQGITLGHGDDFESGAARPHPELTWGNIVDARNVRTVTSSCPRQQAFHDYLGETYALYAGLCRPSCVWLDDDLRVTYHAPARQLCFCDTCLSLFNRQQGERWTRETLVEALDRNEGEGRLRRQWISFCQQSLAEVARTVARAVHEVSPGTRMGLQHANFHRELMEGRDWNPTLDALEEETGLAPASRPGNGFYDDHAPRGMLLKGYDMARQIRRLKPSVREIAAEVEGYRHRATGKSPHGLCVESMFYLAMGATQLSYAIICAASEPMQWYADNYFKSLSAWRPFYEQYVAFNRGTEPGGIDPYIGPDHALRDTEAGEPSLAWIATGAGDMIYDMATLGLPFCPDGNHSSALIMDASAVQGLARDEAARLFGTRGILLDRAAWEQARQRRLDTLLTDVPVPDGLAGVECMISGNGGRTAVVPSFSADVNNAGRLNLLRIADWLSDGKLPAIMETMAQAAVVPRIDSAQNLRSVMLLNCSISK